uniref:Saposin B-type domain-containing protein n=1 Tax=Anisakis simplex TaxID=6269 RepID=A0A0M3K5R8_ANISI
LLFAVFAFNDVLSENVDTASFVREKPKDNYGIKKTVKFQQVDPVTNGYVCLLCTQTITATRELVLAHKTEVSDILEQVCYKLFGQHPAQEQACEALIEHELPYIIKLIEEKVQPHQICINLGLC